MGSRSVLLVVAATAAFAAAAPAAAQEPISPYTDPSFTCEFHHFDEGEAPPLDDLPADDPLCVEYQKRDITVTTGGAVEFLLAEPGRFAAAFDKCQYWQRDHWSVQVAPETTAIVSWDGSYWFDKGAGVGAMRAENFAVGGEPADAEQVAARLEEVDEDLADAVRAYASEGGGGGATFALGAGFPGCEPGPGDEPAAEPSPSDEPNAPTARRGRLAETGGGLAGIAAALSVLAAVLRRRG